MQKSFTIKSRLGFLLSFIVLGLVAAIVFLPNQFSSEAGNRANSRKGLIEKTESHIEGLENYDIRQDKLAIDKLAHFRQSLNKNASAIADLRESFVQGEKTLKRQVPTLKIEYNEDIRTPEVIAPDVKQGRAFLTSPSEVKRAEILRNFAKENNNLIGASDEQINQLKVTADYTNPDGNLSFAHLEQLIKGVPVFRGEIKAGFTRTGEMIRVINNLAPGLEYESLSDDFRNPLDAVKSAARFINADASKLNLTKNDANSNDLKVTFGTGDSATTAEKMYFPTEPGVAVPAWRVLIWQPVNAFYVIVDVSTGAMLWRKNITEDQTQASTYSVYANPNAMINVADNPFPFTPGPNSPNGQQGAAINRTSISRIGNEAPYQFNDNGWITNGGDRTDGNAVQAGLDRDGTDGVDPNSEAINAGRNFTYEYNPLNPNTNTGDAPLGTVFQQGSTTQLFYITNWYHDELYRLGFTEQARNFQNLNFGRGGAENDRIRGEGQDSSGTNNANFSTPADGGRGRMQMYLWTAPNPDIDGNLDAEVVIHEITHGTSNRLHGNGSGLSSNMSRGMGEGWGDFYGNCMLSEPSDTLNGIYTTGAYDTYLSGAGVNNYYYAIRRFPKAVKTFVGANSLPHNPLTFADIDGSQINLNDGAFAPRFVGTADQVHNAGEVWGIALWEVRARFINREGWAIGNRKILQYVTDGMKLAPFSPTFLQERDAIIAAAQLSLPMPQANADVADLWAGFAIRGMGFSAVVTNQGTGAGDARVTQAFDLANLTRDGIAVITDSGGNNNGFPEPGETLAIPVALFNNSGINATGVTLQLVGGGAANFGTIVNNTSPIRNVSYTVPANTPCGSAITLTYNVNSSLGPTSFTDTIIIGVPVTTYSENFDSVTTPNLPAGWLTAQSGIGVSFVSVSTSSDSAPNSVFTPDTSATGGASLTSPSIPITSSAAVVTFQHNYNTENSWDGGALEISINGGAFTDILAAGGRFVTGGYNGTLGTSAGNPVSGRAAWTGNSGGYVITKAQLPASAAGQNVNLRWLFGSDINTFEVGWNVDSVQVAGSYICFAATVKSRADFDGDGKTDLSVFRPSEGNWYLNRSTAGFTVIGWGLSADKLVPSDYDGDGKADAAIYRNGVWYILRSSNGAADVVSWGLASDIPQVGDFDGDGKADQTVYRPSEGNWYIRRSLGGFLVIRFGISTDIPVASDYDGDGKTDIAVYRNGVWYLNQSTAGVSTISFGLATDNPVPADYDGDNKDDVAVFRPSDGTWYILKSSGGVLITAFGISTDVPVPGDYDGDGKDDIAVYRGGTWYLNRSTAGLLITNFGISTDKAIPKQYIP